MNILEVEDLTVAYGRAYALFDVSLGVAPGAMVGLTGPNGAGKSTLLKAISGVLRPRKGDVKIQGVSILGERPHVVTRRGIIQVPEGRGLFPDLSVLDNLRVGALAVGTDVSDQLDLACDIFPRLRSLLGNRAAGLSGGEQQMVAIARGLMARPRVLMIDELSLGLAPKLGLELLASLRRLCETTALSILLVDQNLRLLQRAVRHLYVLDSGRIVTEFGEAELSTIRVSAVSSKAFRS